MKSVLITRGTRHNGNSNLHKNRVIVTKNKNKKGLPRGVILMVAKPFIWRCFVILVQHFWKTYQPYNSKNITVINKKNAFNKMLSQWPQTMEIFCVFFWKTLYQPCNGNFDLHKSRALPKQWRCLMVFGTTFLGNIISVR